MKLYYVPMTRAMRARWLLEETGAPYELHRLDVSTRENRQPAYLALNPLGQVPTLVDGDLVLHESLAIALYVADKFPAAGLAPEPGSRERGEYYKWMAFAMVTIESAVEQFNFHTVRLPEAERSAQVAAAARARFQEVAAVVERALDGREHLVGSSFTAADLTMASVVGWGRVMGLLTNLPRLEEYCRRCFGRPAAKRARAD